MYRKTDSGGSSEMTDPNIPRQFKTRIDELVRDGMPKITAINLAELEVLAQVPDWEPENQKVLSLAAEKMRQLENKNQRC
jgi:hypothetical protein